MLYHACQLPKLKQSCYVEEDVNKPSEASASESSSSKLAEAAPASAPAPAKAALAVSSADTEALQLNQLPSQDTSASSAPPQQPAQQPLLQAIDKASVSADDNVPAGAQQPQAASTPAATKPAGQDQQKQQQQAESAVQQGSSAAAAKTDSAPSSAGGAWGGTKSFRDIAAGNKPEKVCPCLCSGPCAPSIPQHLCKGLSNCYQLSMLASQVLQGEGHPRLQDSLCKEWCLVAWAKHFLQTVDLCESMTIRLCKNVLY